MNSGVEIWVPVQPFHSLAECASLGKLLSEPRLAQLSSGDSIGVRAASGAWLGNLRRCLQWLPSQGRGAC